MFSQSVEVNVLLKDRCSDRRSDLFRLREVSLSLAIQYVGRPFTRPCCATDDVSR